MCRCEGTCIINRPIEKVCVDVERVVINEVNGRARYDFEEVHETSGGIDACPDCANHAEVFYQEYKGRLVNVDKNV